MNAGELRRVLFNVSNQGMTVAQLRDLLFNMEDQDQELYLNFDIVERIEQSKQTGHPLSDDRLQRGPATREGRVSHEYPPLPPVEFIPARNGKR